MPANAVVPDPRLDGVMHRAWQCNGRAGSSLGSTSSLT
jgi:hypothetical protein